MDKRLAFNEDAPNYDRARPTYPAQLFSDVLDYAGITAESRLLEIGIGTGQATLPFLQAGCRITAVELGQDLAAFTRAKYVSFANLDVVNLDFARFDGPDASFDLVYSATAFHWIPPETSYPQVMRLLKPGAAVALFWNHPFVGDDDPIHIATQDCYAMFYEGDRKKNAAFSEQDCCQHIAALERYGFTDMVAKLYRRTRQLSADDYIALLNTYSDHRLLLPERKQALLQGIHAVIERLGGTLTIHDTIDLYLARKPA